MAEPLGIGDLLAAQCPPYDGPLVTRAEAREAGLTRYFTGKQCPHGHVCERIVVNGSCRLCSNAGANAVHRGDPERTLANQRAWRAVNRERRNAKERALNKRSPEKAAARSKRYEAANQEKIRARRVLIAAKIRMMVRTWQLANPERKRAIGRNYRARKNAAFGKHSAADVFAILTAQKSKCAYCRELVGERFHVDHIVALVNGGANDRRNLQICCASCNHRKRASDPVVFARLVGLLI